MATVLKTVSAVTLCSGVRIPRPPLHQQKQPPTCADAGGRLLAFLNSESHSVWLRLAGSDSSCRIRVEVWEDAGRASDAVMRQPRLVLAREARCVGLQSDVAGPVHELDGWEPQVPGIAPRPCVPADPWPQGVQMGEGCRTSCGPCAGNNTRSHADKQITEIRSDGRYGFGCT